MMATLTRAKRAVWRGAEAFQMRLELMNLRARVIALNFENQMLRQRLSADFVARFRKIFVTPDRAKIRIPALDRARMLTRLRITAKETGRWN